MNVILTTLNSQYVHTSLAVRSLRQAFLMKKAEAPMSLIVKEYTINDDWQKIASELFLLQPDLIFFSCYIWNMKEIAKIGNRLKQWLPSLPVLLGGPEVGYRAFEALAQYSWANGIFCGEGEESFPAFLQHWNQHQTFQDIPGLIHRQETKDKTLNSAIYVMEMETLPFPYTAEELQGAKHQILYYESSRGCPYSCQYCLSSVHQPLRFQRLERVFIELDRFISAGVQQVKFVDRTFNANKSRARNIWEYLIDKAPQTNFHFELAADLLEQEDIELLRKAPKGLFQFEIGIQSTNPQTLALVQRVTNFEKISTMVKQIRDLGTIHLHLDLIAGLPGETYMEFSKSFNDVYDLGADMLQLGFLKVLPGTGVEKQARRFGIVYDPEPPYEVLQTHQISARDLLRLHHIEEVFERYGNTGRYHYTIEGLVSFFPQPFLCFETLAQYYEEHHWLQFGGKEATHWQHLWCFIVDQVQNEKKRMWLLQRMKLDFFLKYADEVFPISLYHWEVSSEDKRRVLLGVDARHARQFSASKPKYRAAYLGLSTQCILSPFQETMDYTENKTLFGFVYDYPNSKTCIDWFEVKEGFQTGI